MKNNGKTMGKKKNTDDLTWDFDIEWDNTELNWDLNIEWTEIDYDWGTDDELLETKNNSEDNVRGGVES
jgi:hypothetical protein